MKRKKIEPRPDYRKIVADQGLIFHDMPNNEGVPEIYWHESAYYEFTAPQIEEIERATNELWQMCLAACQHVIDNDLFHLLAIPKWAIPLIKKAWEDEPPSIYGRFDLAYDGVNPPKMLEINADTPTMLLESAVIQWFWKQDMFPEADQFNSIHERLVAKWQELAEYFADRRCGNRLHFAHAYNLENTEDAMTVAYLMDTALEAGLDPVALSMEDIGYDSGKNIYVDLEDRDIMQIFKLYPWEWMCGEEEEHGLTNLVNSADKTQWIEPIWKMLLSNKGILAILWKLYPNHPHLLEAHLDGSNGMTEYAKKPLLSREGANITIKSEQGNVEIEGDYGEEGFVFQKFFNIPEHDGKRPILGSWVIDGESAGMGVREADGLVTDNGSIMTPHIFV